MTKQKSQILKDYELSLESYYKEYARFLGVLTETQQSPHTLHKQFKAAIGGLGAQIGKAGQRARRELVFSMLKAERRINHADLTFHVVEHIGKATTGRKFTTSEIVKEFSTAGRKANERTALTDDQIESMIERITPAVEHQRTQLEEIRAAENARLHAMPSYQATKQLLAAYLKG